MSFENKNPWIEYWLPRPDAQVRLICFPHVGGSAALYRKWASRLHDNVELCAVELPGRGRRFGEKPFVSLKDCVAAFHANLSLVQDKPFFLFGHSMGALMAYEWSVLLNQEKQCLPQGIFLSAFGAPHVTPRPEKLLHLLEDKKFIEELKELKGTPPEVLQHQELMDLLMPMIRADLQMVETYHYEPNNHPLPMPFHVMGGLEDEQVQKKHLEAWKDLTSTFFDLSYFEGGHFFIQSAQKQVIDRISAGIERWLCGF